MNQWLIKDLVRQTMIAATYTVLVYIFGFASFGLIQFRIAEVLMILIFFDKKNMIGLTLGCFIANLISGAILVDVLVGPIATLLAGILMWQFKKFPMISLIFPAIFNGIIVGFILTYGYLLAPLIVSIPSVFIGEFAVMYVLGLPIYLFIKKNPGFIEFFKN